jgi:hypothetical protein
MAKIYLARKATLGYSLTCSFHQSKGDLTSSLKFIANNEKKNNLVKSFSSYASTLEIGVSKRGYNGPSTAKIQVHATRGFKKLLHFISKGIKVLLSYFVAKV